jgi:hypothetical protein
MFCTARFASVLTITLAWMLSGMGASAVNVYEGFSGAGYHPGEFLHNLDGGTPGAFEAAWEDPDFGSGGEDRIRSGSLSFTGESGSLLNSGHSVLLAGTSGSSVNMRDLTNIVPANGSELWLSFLIEKTTAGALTATDPNGLRDFALFRVVMTGAAPTIAFGDTSTGKNISLLRESGPATTVPSTTEFGTATSYFLVAKFTFGAAATDRVDLFINPAPGGSAPTAAAASLTSQNIPGIALLELAAGNHGAGASYTFDEIRIGDTYAAVGPVPEPGAVGLLAIGAAALTLRRGRSVSY